MINFVVSVFFRCRLRRPLAVATEAGRYFLMFSTVIAGKEVGKFSLTALMSVDTGGLNRAVWMNATVSAMVVDGRTALAMLNVVGSKIVQKIVLMAMGWLRLVYHNFVRGSRFS